MIYILTTVHLRLRSNMHILGSPENMGWLPNTLVKKEIADICGKKILKNL